MIRRITKLCSLLGIKHISQHKKVSMSMPEEPQSPPEEPQSPPEEPQSPPEEPQSSPEGPQSSPEGPQSSPEEPQESLQPPRAPKPEFLTETKFDEFNLPAVAATAGSKT